MTKRPHHHEHAYRSIAKTISYRVVISIELFFVTWYFTKSLNSALQLTGWTAIASTVIYYLHERAWAHIAWGRTKPNRSSK